MEKFENVVLEFVELCSTKKNERNERTAKFYVSFGDNPFGIECKQAVFTKSSKTAKQLRDVGKVECKSITCSISGDGYRWIKTIQV